MHQCWINTYWINLVHSLTDIPCARLKTDGSIYSWCIFAETEKYYPQKVLFYIFRCMLGHSQVLYQLHIKGINNLILERNKCKLL